jgi:hypothetical protein
MLAPVALLAVGGLLGLHVYRLEARLASLEASAERRGPTVPGPVGNPEGTAAPGVMPPRAGSTQATALHPTRRTLRLDDGAARQVAQRLGGELGLEQERVEKLARFLMAFHLRAALANARARGEDVSESAASHPELLRGDLEQELRGLRLSQTQLAVLARQTPGLEALLSH